MKIQKHTSGGFTIIVIFSLLTLLSFNFSFAQNGWYKLNSGTTSDLNSVFFVNQSTGWAAGRNIILNTNNGGGAWTQQEFPNLGENIVCIFKGVCFANPDNGWIVGEYYNIFAPEIINGIILHTDNAGINWSIVNTGSTNSLGSVCHKTPEAGWTVGQDVILRSTNQGHNWIEQNLPPAGENDYYTLKSVCFINQLTGWAAGNLYKDPPAQNYRVILKTVNGGNNWIQEYCAEGNGFNAVTFCGSAAGWAVTDNQILKTGNGGISWDVKAGYGGLNTIYSLKSVYFFDSMTGWVTGGSFCTVNFEYNSVFIKTTDGGNNWILKSIPVAMNEYIQSSVFFADSLHGWSAGKGGAIFKTIDGGTTGINPVGSNLPGSYNLHQNYPNPFNPVTHIKFEIPKTGNVMLSVYDITGREVEVLVNEKLQPGTYEVTFDAGNLPSGVYFYKLTTDNFIDTRKLILLK